MSTFTIALDAFAKEAPDKARTVVRKVAQEAGARVVLRSPVDTGRFRANWAAGVGAPNLTTTLATDKAGQGTIAKLTSAALRWDGEGDIYVTNSLPYAQRLEYGYSKQAPAGMVRITVAEFQTMVDAAAKAGA